MSNKHVLPSKLFAQLRRLALEYTQSSDRVLLEVINGGRFLVIEETYYRDGWDPPSWGHDVRVFLPAEVMGKMRLNQQRKFADKLKDDLNTASTIQNEYFESLGFELADEDDPQYQSARPLSQRPQVNPDNLSIWKSGHLRLFISHRDEHKLAATKIAEGLEPLGVSGFVAHHTIEPMSTWRSEILNGLETMEIMLACITDDFHEGSWTDQEVGFALGRGIPIIRLKLQSQDPRGFIGDIQAMRGDLSNPEASIDDIYRVLCDKLGQGKRLKQSMIAAFIASPNFDETRSRFDRMNAYVHDLSKDEVFQIVDAFGKTETLYHAIWLTNHYNRLTKFMERSTGKKFVIEGKKLKIVVEDDDEMPF
ncbi:MAG: toll/interleukin-1 receptor domain-containing protein [Rhodospirillaceae bacterium]